MPVAARNSPERKDGCSAKTLIAAVLAASNWPSLQAEAGDHAKFVDTCTASAYLLRAMKFKPLPAGFVIPAQPIKASKPPSGADWVHEINHDGYRNPP
jgi:ATP-dependent DNA ligase